MDTSSTVNMLAGRSENLKKSVLTFLNELKNTNNEIRNTIEANKSAAIQHGEAIEQIHAANEALEVLHEDNVQFIQRIESIVNEELNNDAE